MERRGASRTAVLVCQGRAVADGRLALGFFSDAIAAEMLTEGERSEVERARDDTPPTTTRERLACERLRAFAAGVVPRTVLIDDAIRTAGNRQVVILGAGLDTRPWRMHELGGVDVYSVDHAASQEDCRRRTAGLAAIATRLEFVSVDLSEQPLGPALHAAGHDAAATTTWVWEGVVPYLSPDAVERTIASIEERSARGSTLVVQYQQRSVVARFGRKLSAFIARRTGLDDPLTAEPWRSLWTPASMAELLARRGFVVEGDDDLLTAAERIGSPTTHRRSLTNGRVAVGRRL